jgi:hypothetical protein
MYMSNAKDRQDGRQGLRGRESVVGNLLYLRVRWKEEGGEVAQGRNSRYFLLSFFILGIIKAFLEFVPEMR